MSVRGRAGALAAMVVALAAVNAAAAQGNTADPAPQQPSRLQRAEQIASQPARDVGARKVAVPPVLQKAIEAPYATTGAANCGQIKASLTELNKVLGADFAAGAQSNENRASKIAEAGGKTVVNSLIPFRGLVREFTGAAPSERRLNAAIDAGYARRGFLRGLAAARKCRL